jgi:hypothetical protein
MKALSRSGVAWRAPLLDAAALAADPKSLAARDVSPTTTPSRYPLHTHFAALIEVQ